ncbi:MAG: LysE family transporter [Thermoleophilaceae bacterium]|nr:LysE family transporter [Thermoleophilaceae bacterium]
MSPLSTLLTVAAVHWLAMVSPGPNVLLVAQTAMARSRGSALAAALGVATGAGLLATAAALGLGLAIDELAWLRQALQVAGGAYVAYLGLQIWRGARDPPRPEAGASNDAGRARYYARGLLTNLSNPKAAVFFASVLTAALDKAVSTWVRLAAVGVIVVDAVAWHCLLALLFGRPGVTRWYGRRKPLIDHIVGAGLVLLGARLATLGL